MSAESGTRAVVDPRTRRAHYRALCEVIRAILVGSARPSALRAFAALAVRRGLPVDPGALFAPDSVLEAEARYLGLALPALRSLHGDCRGWLASRLRKPEDRVEGSIPWNLALGS